MRKRETCNVRTFKFTGRQNTGIAVCCSPRVEHGISKKKFSGRVFNIGFRGDDCPGVCVSDANHLLIINI